MSLFYLSQAFSISVYHDLCDNIHAQAKIFLLLKVTKIGDYATDFYDSIYCCHINQWPVANVMKLFTVVSYAF